MPVHIFSYMPINRKILSFAIFIPIITHFLDSFRLFDAKNSPKQFPYLIVSKLRIFAFIFKIHFRNSEIKAIFLKYQFSSCKYRHIITQIIKVIFLLFSNMLINKIFGSICVIVGGILVFSWWFVEKNDVFLISLVGGPTLIYLGLKLLNYI